jgi:3-oxoadipate enol-lactonase
MPYFEHGKIRVHYEIHEGLVERDVLAIHGNLASNIWWKPVIDELRAGGANKKGRFIAAEWRGCGRTSGIETEADLTLPALADDYNALLRHLHAKNVGILAHSTGGLIALHMMRTAPELYARALLLDPVGATGVQFGPEMYQAFTMMSQDRGMAEAVMTGTISKFVEDTAFLKKIVDDAFGVHPAIWHGVAKMLHDHDFRSELSHIQQPVLVLHGEKDQILPMEASKALAAGLPHGKFLELAGRGHSTNIEDPALLVSHIQQFLLG